MTRRESWSSNATRTELSPQISMILMGHLYQSKPTSKSRFKEWDQSLQRYWRIKISKWIQTRQRVILVSWSTQKCKTQMLTRRSQWSTWQLETSKTTSKIRNKPLIEISKRIFLTTNCSAVNWRATLAKTLQFSVVSSNRVYNISLLTLLPKQWGNSRLLERKSVSSTRKILSSIGSSSFWRCTSSNWAQRKKVKVWTIIQ